MAITRYYDVDCNICEKEFAPKLGGLAVENLEIVEKAGWLLFYTRLFPSAAVCPDCWEQIVNCSKGQVWAVCETGK